MSLLCITLCTIFICLIQITAGSGILSIKFIKYNNSEGNTRDGKICDPVLQNCDYYFTLCVDHLEEQMPHCKLGRKKITGVTLQSNNIVFQDKIGRTKTPNPMEFYFKRWLTGFNITVKVWSKDHRHNRDDLVDSFSVDINYLNGSSQIDENRTQFEFLVTVKCDILMCGQHCDEDCPRYPAISNNSWLEFFDPFKTALTQWPLECIEGFSCTTPNSESQTGLSTNSEGTAIAVSIPITIILLWGVIMAILFLIEKKMKKDAQPNSSLERNVSTA